MKHAGKLLLQHEIHQEELSYYSPVPSIQEQRFGSQCMRCGNTKSYLFGHMPHDACQKSCLYCRNCIQMGRVMECEPLYQGTSTFEWPRYDRPLQWSGELTPWQQKGADAVKDCVLGGEELLVWAVCVAKNEYAENAVKNSIQYRSFLYR